MTNEKQYLALIFCLWFVQSSAQHNFDSTQKIHQYKNEIRYNLSSALVFGVSRYIVFGYERVIGHNQSISVDVGAAKLPKLISISTDSFSVQRDRKSSGSNLAVDYRFYLGKENKYPAPRGLYIGPYYSYDHFTRDNDWMFLNSATNNDITTHSTFNINTIGFQLGYQLILWKRLSLDFVMVGPGLGFYDYRVTFNSTVTAEEKKQLLDGLQQLLTQKFPGMNYVFSDTQINGDGVLKRSSIGYRYIIHVGFLF
jgi:hypothetical protein